MNKQNKIGFLLTLHFTVQVNYEGQKNLMKYPSLFDVYQVNDESNLNMAKIVF